MKMRYVMQIPLMICAYASSYRAKMPASRASCLRSMVLKWKKTKKTINIVYDKSVNQVTE